MEKIQTFFKNYLWVAVIFIVIAIGANIYFTVQPLGLVFVLSGLMLILAMENSDMIHAVEEQEISSKWYKTFFVHFHSQKTIALFIYWYHFYIYGYLIVLSGILLIIGNQGMKTYSNVLNILIISLFGAAAITIFIRRILVGAKYEH